jgi:hypothetical protein
MAGFTFRLEEKTGRRPTRRRFTPPFRTGSQATRSRSAQAGRFV